MSDYTLIILATFFGFMLLAAILLVPVYRFLKREESLSEGWTREGVEEQRVAYEARMAEEAQKTKEAR